MVAVAVAVAVTVVVAAVIQAATSQRRSRQALQRCGKLLRR